jgi:Immune inhibitor A-like, MAM domain/Secretion system C-terminal sorting domain
MKAAKISYVHLLIVMIFLFLGISFSSAQTIVFSDDFESGATNWTLSGSWGLATNDFYSGANSLTESPLGDYTNMQNSSATMTNNLDLSSYLSAEISFWTKYNIENAFDYMYLEISNDGGITFVKINEFTGILASWTEHTYNIGTFAGNSNVKVRFRFFSDQAVVGDGMYIDDLTITGSAIDNSAPLIVLNGPEFYEGVLGDYEVNSEISDASGIASTTLFYLVDGNGPYSINGSHINGDQYNFVIPAQSPGANVSYKIKAEDNANPANGTDTSSAPEYQYIAGSYLSYDDAGVDALATISNTAAAAVKISVPVGQYGFLVAALIRNYTDTNNSNDDMLFHVWDDNNGLPGIDLITPFLVTPEASLDHPYPFTRIDLRSYSPQLDDLTGDFFIGITVPQNSVNLLVSNNSSSRSFSFDGANWNPTPLTKDYQFRAIINESLTPLPVELTTFNANVNETSVTLNWETATEVNNYGFEVERQNLELSSQTSEWELVGFVDGHGNSNSPKYYLYEDNRSILSGKYFYRLKQIDIDGSFEYSDVVEVSLSTPDNFSLDQNYPNPFNPTTIIGYSIPEFASATNASRQVIIKVYDILGNEIKSLVNDNKAPGKYEVEFDASELSNGVYFYQIKVGNFSQINKMTLIK